MMMMVMMMIIDDDDDCYNTWRFSVLCTCPSCPRIRISSLSFSMEMILMVMVVNDDDGEMNAMIF